MITDSNEQLQQQLEYTLLKPDCHSWWISKMQSGHEDTFEERYAIKLYFKLGKHASVWELHNYSRGTEGAEHLHEVCPNGAQRRSERRCHDSREMVELINSNPTVLDALVSCDESWIYRYDPETKRQISQWKHAGSPRPKKARQSKSTHKILMIHFLLEHWHWIPTRQTVNKEYYVEVFREFRKSFRRRGQHSSNRVSGISTRTMHQSTTPSLSQTIWPRWASRQFLSLPIVQTLFPVTFAYSLCSMKNLQAVVMRKLRRLKRLWRRSLTHSHKRNPMGPSRSCWNITCGLQLEDITSEGTRVSCVYYQ